MVDPYTIVSLNFMIISIMIIVFFLLLSCCRCFYCFCRESICLCVCVCVELICGFGGNTTTIFACAVRTFFFVPHLYFHSRSNFEIFSLQNQMARRNFHSFYCHWYLVFSWVSWVSERVRAYAVQVTCGVSFGCWLVAEIKIILRWLKVNCEDVVESPVLFQGQVVQL